MQYLPVVGTLVVGVIVGYYAQRARLCFIGGFRDFYLFKDTHLLKGLACFILAAALAFLMSRFMLGLVTFPWLLDHGVLPVPGAPLSAGKVALQTPASIHILLAVTGGLLTGFFSVFAGGCPLRQAVMAAGGNKTSVVYVVGFGMGAVVFHLVLAQVL